MEENMINETEMEATNEFENYEVEDSKGGIGLGMLIGAGAAALGYGAYKGGKKLLGKVKAGFKAKKAEMDAEEVKEDSKVEETEE